MKTALLKHYGKILVTIFLLGLEAYSGFATGKLRDLVNAPEPAVVVPVQTSPDAGQ